MLRKTPKQMLSSCDVSLLHAWQATKYKVSIDLVSLTFKSFRTHSLCGLKAMKKSTVVKTNGYFVNVSKDE